MADTQAHDMQTQVNSMGSNGSMGSEHIEHTEDAGSANNAKCALQGCALGEGEQLAQMLARVQTRLWGLLDTELRTRDAVPMASYDVLQCVSHMPLCRPADIRAELALSSGGVTKVLDRLESDGLVRRVANAQDRRSSTIELTEHGTEALSIAQSVINSIVMQVLGHVSDLDHGKNAESGIHMLGQLNQVLITRCWDVDHTSELHS